MNIKAYVIETKGDDALVVANRRSTCDSCVSNCDGCYEAKKLKVVVKNPIGAVQGDFVLVKYAKINLASFSVFILPLLLGLVVYFLATGNAREYAAAYSVVTMLAGFISLYIVVGRISYKFGRPEIEKVVLSDEEEGADK